MIVPEEAREEARVEGLSQDLLRTVIDEDVFVSQLHRRARVLNSDFQAKVLEIVSRCGPPRSLRSVLSPTLSLFNF